MLRKNVSRDSMKEGLYKNDPKLKIYTTVDHWIRIRILKSGVKWILENFTNNKAAKLNEN